MVATIIGFFLKRWTKAEIQTFKNQEKKMFLRGNIGVIVSCQY